MAKFDFAIKALINQITFLKDYRQENENLRSDRLANLNKAIDSCLEAITVLKREQKGKH